MSTISAGQTIYIINQEIEKIIIIYIIFVNNIICNFQMQNFNLTKFNLN